ncbi:MAG TPA: hypothetical protein VK190_11310 [Pseudoneobacillus sp.]|nr:hypothetical protein [Pseudoneobacillus sp.]
MNNIILALDPSGNFHEGKGTTGYAIAVNGQPSKVGRVSASDYKSAPEYWYAHMELINQVEPNQLVFEGYRLYNHKGMSAATQANSILETPQLIGYLTMIAFLNQLPLKIQFAKDVKTRWSDDVLINKSILVKNGKHLLFKSSPTVTHERDALRHLMHFIRYGGK